MLIAEATTSASPIAGECIFVAMPQMLHLRIGEHLVDRVDRPARHAGAFEQLDPVFRRLVFA